MKSPVLLVLFSIQSCLAFLPSNAVRLMPRASELMRMVEQGISFPDLDGSSVRIGIIRTRWNEGIVSSLHEGVKEALKKCNVKQENVFDTEVPGSFELPLAARFLALSQTVDAIVCLGCLIKGETMHFEYISEAVSSGLMQVGLQTSCPIVFGVLTTLTEEQAVARSREENNHGYGWGMTAVEMGLLRMSALGQAQVTGMGFGKMEELTKKDSKMDDGKKIGF